MFDIRRRNDPEILFSHWSQQKNKKRFHFDLISLMWRGTNPQQQQFLKLIWPRNFVKARLQCNIDSVVMALFEPAPTLSGS